MAEFCRRLARRFRRRAGGRFPVRLLGNFGLTVALGAIEQAIAARQVKETLAGTTWMEIARRCEEERIASDVATSGVCRNGGRVIMARRGVTRTRHCCRWEAARAAEDMTELLYSDAAPSAEDIAQLIAAIWSRRPRVALFLPEVAALGVDLARPPTSSRFRSRSMPRWSRRRRPRARVPDHGTAFRSPSSARAAPAADVRVVASDGFVATARRRCANQVISAACSTSGRTRVVAFVAAVVQDGYYRFEMKPMWAQPVPARAGGQQAARRDRPRTPRRAGCRASCVRQRTSPLAAQAAARGGVADADRLRRCAASALAARPRRLLIRRSVDDAGGAGGQVRMLGVSGRGDARVSAAPRPAVMLVPVMVVVHVCVLVLERLMCVHVGVPLAHQDHGRRRHAAGRRRFAHSEAVARRAPPANLR